MGRRKQLRNVERRSWRRADGTVAETFRVRWVDEDGARQRETFDTAEEAVAFRDELEARVAMLRGGPAERARMTVADGYERWWAEHVEPTLERRTQDGYRRVWESHLAARVGDLLLIDLTTARIEQLKDAMLGDGVGAHTVRKAIALLVSAPAPRPAVSDALRPLGFEVVGSRVFRRGIRLQVTVGRGRPRRG